MFIIIDSVIKLKVLCDQLQSTTATAEAIPFFILCLPLYDSAYFLSDAAVQDIGEEVGDVDVIESLTNDEPS